MNRITHLRPSPAMVVAFVALFVALCGSAAALTGSNTVFSDDITDGQVKTPDLATGAVKTPKLANNAVTTPKLGTGAVKTPKLATGAVTSAKVADNSLTGADVNESTLAGVVPGGSAGGDLTGTYPSPTIAGNAVNSAKVADNSLTGSDVNESTLSGVAPGGAAGGDLTGSYPDPLIGANTITGSEVINNSISTDDVNGSLTADDLSGISIFATADRSSDDAVGGGSTDVTMLDNPNGFPYDVIGHCTENPAGTVLATVAIKSTIGSTTAAVDSTAPGGVNDNVAVPGAAERTIASLGPTTAAHWGTGSYSITSFSASSPNIRNMSGTVSVGTKVASTGVDCKFNATGIG